MIKITRKQQEQTQGMPAERTEMPAQPFTASAPISARAEAQSPQRRNLKPFTAFDANRNYRALYRAACDFHERNNPPRLADDNGAEYWANVCDDMTATANAFDNDPFLASMLCAVFEELEREWKEMQSAGKAER